MINQQQRGRLILLAISASFIIPIIAAAWLYFGPGGWRPGTQTQHGELLTPPVELPDSIFGASTGELQFRKVWTLAVLADRQCDSVCITALEHIRQIRLSLGPKMPRLQTVLLPLHPTAVATVDSAAFPKLLIAQQAAAELVDERLGTWQNGQIFVVDPLGNVILSYAPDAAMGDVRADLAQLLKLSGIG